MILYKLFINKLRFLIYIIIVDKENEFIEDPVQLYPLK